MTDWDRTSTPKRETGAVLRPLSQGSTRPGSSPRPASWGLSARSSPTGAMGLPSRKPPAHERARWHKPLGDFAEIGTGLAVGYGRQAGVYCWTPEERNITVLKQIRDEAEAAKETARNEADECRRRADDADRRADEAERRAGDAEVDAMRKVREAEWAADQRIVEVEVENASLVNLLEQERHSHKESLAFHGRLADHARAEAERRVQEAEQRCANDVQAAQGRAEAAEHLAEDVQRDAEARIASVRAQQAAAVEEARKEATRRVEDSLADKLREVERMRSELEMRKTQLEDDLQLKTKQTEEATQEARRYAAAVNADAAEWKMLQEADLAQRKIHLDEEVAKQRRQHEDLEKHWKGMIEMEKGMHSKTVERTMGRVCRRLRLGDTAYFDHRNTLTGEAMENAWPSPMGQQLKHLAQQISGNPDALAS
eukprot:TRINITY_DN105209_c0_g1_i1.p1 TRINITY_DN105209_c0_g1~~TRINITY_DN105209_c0_g1_i1.p1  ORF type:complete len:427 (-),score=123.29 TRINITY_DN105209_c0_g1_i1:56-1336(-)